MKAGGISEDALCLSLPLGWGESSHHHLSGILPDVIWLVGFSL